MKFEEYEEVVGSMGENTGAYRDLNLNFIQYKGKKYTFPDLYNELIKGREDKNDTLSLGGIFSAAISYLGTYVYNHGYSFDYFNSFQRDKELIKEALLKNEIMTIVIPTTLYTSIFPLIEIISFIKKYNSSSKIIVGGPLIATQIRVQDKETLDYILEMLNADFYINSSQGEEALTQILSALKSNGEYELINNIYYRKDGKYFSNEINQENNLLSDNMVNWKLFANKIESAVNIRTAISCPFSCSFCGFPQHAGKYQVADIEGVKKELAYLGEIKKVNSINFIDDTFNIPKERFKEILKHIINHKYRFKWNSYLRCQFIDREIVELMRESGCQGVFLGIESGSQKILENMNKATTLEKYREGIKLLRENGITTFASFIVGFPGETEETVRETINFIEETKPTFFRTQLWYCEPITPIWREKQKYEIKGSQFEWSHKTMNVEKACKVIESNFLNIKNSIWLPQYNFDTVGLYNLINKGNDLSVIKELIIAFNEEIKKKLINPNAKEIDGEIFEKFKCLADEAKKGF